MEGKGSLDRRKLHGLGVWKGEREGDSELEETRPSAAEEDWGGLKPESGGNVSKGLEASF